MLEMVQILTNGSNPYKCSLTLLAYVSFKCYECLQRRTPTYKDLPMLTETYSDAFLEMLRKATND